MNWPNRRTLLSSALAGLFAAGLALPAQQAFADTTIRMWTFVNPESTGGRSVVLKKLIEEFEAANPGVRIEVENQVWQQLTSQFLAAHQTGTAPDVSTLMLRRIHEPIEMGALANLNELFIDEWSEEELADIDGPLLRYNSTPDARYHITHWISTRGHFYRKDLFEEAGIDPASLTTWDAMIDAAKRLTTKDDAGNVLVWGYGQAYPTEGANLPLLGSAVLADQGDIFDKDNKANWATPAGAAGLALQRDMITVHGVTPDTLLMDYEDLYDGFHAGRYAIIGAGVPRLPNAQAALGPLNVGYLRTPTFEGGYAPAEVIGWSKAVWSGSPNIELAGKWVEFISSPRADELWATEAGMIPIRRSTIENNPDFFERPENDYLVHAAAELATGWLSPSGVAGGFNDELNRAGQDVLLNDADPLEALQRAQDAFNRRRN